MNNNFEMARASFEESADFDPVPFIGSKIVPVPYHGSVYEHKNGNLYAVFAVTNIDSVRPDYPRTVCYVGTNGKVWSKTLGNFMDKMKPSQRKFEFQGGVSAFSFGIGGIPFLTFVPKGQHQ